MCEIIPEDDFDVIRALLSWDFTDEMELEEDDLGKSIIFTYFRDVRSFLTLSGYGCRFYGTFPQNHFTTILDDLRKTWNMFALDFRSAENEESSKIGLWRKHFENESLVDVARKLFI